MHREIEALEEILAAFQDDTDALEAASRPKRPLLPMRSDPLLESQLVQIVSELQAIRGRAPDDLVQTPQQRRALQYITSSSANPSPTKPSSSHDATRPRSSAGRRPKSSRSSRSAPEVLPQNVRLICLHCSSLWIITLFSAAQDFCS